MLSEVFLERGDARAFGAPNPRAHELEERPVVEGPDGTEVATQCRDPAGYVDTATRDGRKRVDRDRDDFVHDASAGQTRWCPGAGGGKVRRRVFGRPGQVPDAGAIVRGPQRQAENPIAVAQHWEEGW